MPIDGTPEIVWRTIGPILALSIGAVITLMMTAFRPRISRLKLAIVTMASVIASGAATLVLALDGRELLGMQGMVAVDGVALFTNLIVLMTVAVVTLLAYGYLQQRRIHRAEFYPLLLLAAAGMLMLASANDLIMVFIGIEVLSLALYIMVGLARRDDGAQEASMKYFLLGAFSSAILLYGVALAYGATGTTNISQIALVATTSDTTVLLLAAGLLAVGFAFKVGAVPFHMWTPDVYQGAPTAVTGFMAAGTKAAGFAAFFRVMLVAFGTLQWEWRPALWAVAVVTMVVGSLLAIVQSDAKRLLAYSSIAHAGFLLIGLVAANRSGTAATLFYLLVYAVMTLGAFAAVMLSAPEGRERLDLTSWVGLGQRHPVFAGAMTLFLLSLAGIPPTAGFMAKLFMFRAAIEAGENGLVIAGVLSSVIAAFFYLRLIVLMWLQEPAEDVEPIGMTRAGAVALGFTAAVTVALGVWPQGLIDLARAAAIFTG